MNSPIKNWMNCVKSLKLGKSWHCLQILRLKLIDRLMFPHGGIEGRNACAILATRNVHKTQGVHSVRKRPSLPIVVVRFGTVFGLLLFLCIRGRNLLRANHRDLHAYLILCLEQPERTFLR